MAELHSNIYFKHHNSERKQKLKELFDCNDFDKFSKIAATTLIRHGLDSGAVLKEPTEPYSTDFDLTISPLSPENKLRGKAFNLENPQQTDGYACGFRKTPAHKILTHIFVIKSLRLGLINNHQVS